MSPNTLLQWLILAIGFLGLISVLLMLGMLGAFGWLFRFCVWLKDRPEIQKVQSARPSLPPIQFWMQDLCIVAAFFGVAMCPIAVYEPNRVVVLILAMYLLVSCVLGFFLAMDALRCGHEPRSALWRLGLVMPCLVLSSLGLIIGGLISWLAWRKALIRFELSRFRLKQEVDIQGARPV